MRTAALLLAVGCATPSVEPQPAPVGVPFEDTDDPTDTPPHDGFTPHAFTVLRARFGFDADANRIVPGIEETEDGEEALPIRVTVALLDADAASTGTLHPSNHCTVALERTEPIEVAGWSGSAGAWAAFTVQGGLGSTTCGPLDFPPSWGANPVAHVTRWAWGAGLNPLSDDAVALLGASYDALAPWIVGAGFHWEGLPDFPDSAHADDYADGYVDVGIAQGWALDDGVVGSPLSADEMQGGASGWYEIQVPRLLTPADVLLDP